MVVTKKDIQMIQNTNFTPPPMEVKSKEVTRKEYNERILDVLHALVEAFPDQRFGQLICNYILPEYREKDPFFEESKVTLERLTKLVHIQDES